MVDLVINSWLTVIGQFELKLYFDYFIWADNLSIVMLITIGQFVMLTTIGQFVMLTTIGQFVMLTTIGQLYCWYLQAVWSFSLIRSLYSPAVGPALLRPFSAADFRAAYITNQESNYYQTVQW
jgi:hypothetical protein